MLGLEARTKVGPLDLDVRLEVASGECLAVAGPSGGGKTTLLRIAAGLRGADHGRVECGGEVWLDTARGVSVAPERRRVGYLFQDYALFPNLSVWRNVAFGMDGVARRERRELAVELLDRFGMAARADSRPAGLSGGERQRVALARALARRPHALLLDEPLSALDSRTRAGAARELTGLMVEAKVPTLLVTHDFGEAAVLADRVAVIDGGRVVQTGTAAALAGAPTSAFVADFTGAVVLHGVARRGEDGLTRVELDGGGCVASTDGAGGRVAVSVHPWEIELEPAGATGSGSAQNRLAATVSAVSPLGNRTRVALLAPQALTAELTQAATERLALAPGVPVVAVWKATATRLVAL